jgi:hypothetical protein
VVAPVITAIACQDITVADMQKIVNSAPTSGEGERLHRCLSAMVAAGIHGGYLVNPRLREVHWQAARRPVPAPNPVCPANRRCGGAGEIPADADVAKLAPWWGSLRSGPPSLPEGFPDVPVRQAMMSPALVTRAASCPAMS